MEKPKTIQQRIIAAQLIQPGERILAGFSGGSDSAALCHALAELRRELGFSLELLYIQHNLRGEESLAEEAFVREWAERYDCRLSIRAVNVRETAKQQKLSIETAARKLRYLAFQERAESGFDKVALAHHAKDQAETVLQHFLRGSGVDGLCGMKPQNGIYIRPLLLASKEEIKDYLQKENIAWREDSSNEDRQYRRNRIRHELLPYLQTHFNPNLVQTLTENAKQMQDLQLYLQEQTEQEFEQLAYREADGLRLAGDRLKRLSVFLQRLLIRRAVQEAKGNTADLESTHIARAVSLLEKENGKREDLIGGWQVKKEAGDLIFFRQEGEPWPREKTVKNTEFFPLRLDISGRKRYIKIIEGFVFCARILEQRPEKRDQKKWSQVFDMDFLPAEAVLRHPLPEDYIRIDRQGRKKRLKDLLADQKLAREKRSRVPVLAAGSEILWAVGYRVGYPYRVTEATKNYLELTILGRTGKCQGLRKEYQDRK